MEEKIRSGKCRHDIRTIGSRTDGKYVAKYVVDLKTETVITEVRIYADERGEFHIPAQYRSDVTYGENVKAAAVVLYSEGVMANDRIAAFLNSIGGDALGLSEGSVYGFCKKFSQDSEESILHLEGSLFNIKPVRRGNGRNHRNRKWETELYPEFQYGKDCRIPRHEFQVHRGIKENKPSFGLRRAAPA